MSKAVDTVKVSEAANAIFVMSETAFIVISIPCAMDLMLLDQSMPFVLGETVTRCVYCWSSDLVSLPKSPSVLNDRRTPMDSVVRLGPEFGTVVICEYVIA